MGIRTGKVWAGATYSSIGGTLIILLTCLGQRAGAATITVSDSYNNFTDINHVLNVNQFDSLGGTRTLLSVEIIADVSLTSSLTGTIKNNSSSQTAFYSASLNNASTSLSGTGLGTLSDSSATLYSLPSTSIAPTVTFTLPGTLHGSLGNSNDILLTSGLSPFIGNGQLSYSFLASAVFNSSLTGSSNTTKHVVLDTEAASHVKLIYTYETAAVPLPAPAVGGAALLGVAFVGSRLRGRTSLIA